MELEKLLTLLVQVEGSDLHLCAGEPPTMRVQRVIRRTKFPEMPGVRSAVSHVPSPPS